MPDCLLTPVYIVFVRPSSFVFLHCIGLRNETQAFLYERSSGMTERFSRALSDPPKPEIDRSDTKSDRLA